MNRAMVLMVALVLGMPALASEVEEREVVQEPASAPESQSTVTKKIYKSYSKDGSVKFTDEPVDGSQEIEVRESNRVRFVRPEMPVVPDPEQEEQASPAYQLSILAPGDQSHFHNHPDPIPVNLSITPVLREGDRLEVTDNGEPVAPGDGGQFVLEFPHRGEHRLVARVVSSDDDVLVESEAVTIYIHRVSALNKPKGTPTPKPGPKPAP